MTSYGYYGSFWAYDFSKENKLVDQITELAKIIELARPNNSHVYKDQSLRDELNGRDRLAGNFVQATLSRFWYGNFDEYFRTQMQQVQDGVVGDGGSDIEGYNIDVKGSTHLYKTQARNYHLLVCYQEIREKWIYVFGVYFPQEMIVALCGWANTDLVMQYNGENKHGKKYMVPVKNLRSMQSLRYSPLVRKV